MVPDELYVKLAHWKLADRGEKNEQGYLKAGNHTDGQVTSLMNKSPF